MAYKLEDLKLIPGSINLVSPGDQVASGDSLDLTGWWPGSIGKLQQTKGWTQRASGVGTVPRAITEENGRLYFATGALLHQAGRGLIAGGFADAPGLLGFKSQLWIMSQGAQKRDDGTNYLPWSGVTPAAPTSANTTGESLPDGDYEYYVTWVDMQLWESQPGPALAVVFSGGTNDGKVTITQPAAPAAPAVFGWNVYRKSPSTFQIYKVNSAIIPIATTTYVDTGGLGQTVDDLVGAGEVMEEDHQAAPAAKVMANATYNDRIIVANTLANPNRIFYTKPGQPAFFPTDNYVDCGADSGDPVLYISVKAGMLIVYRQRSIWRQVGDFDDENARLEVFVPEIGVVGRNAVAPTSKGDYFVGGRSGVADGVYLLTDWAQKVSQKIAPVFEEFEVENYNLLVQAYASECALGFTGGRLWFSYARAGLYDGNNQTFILDVETDRWFSREGGFGVYYNGSQYFYGAGPGNTGTIQSLEDGLSDNGTATPLAYQSAYEDCGSPDHEKTWADLVIDHNTHGATLTLSIRINKLRTGGGVDSFTMTTINSTTQTRQTIPLYYPASYPTVAKRFLPIRARNLSVRIEGQGPASGFAEIHTPMLLHYYLEARGGQTFDTGLTDLGMPGVVKAVDRLELDMDATQNVTLGIYSDVPGGVPVLRDLVNIAATGGRKIVPLTVTEREGRLFRFLVVDQSGLVGVGDGFQIYAIRARALPIGVFVDGQFSETWQSTALGLGA